MAKTIGIFLLCFLFGLITEYNIGFFRPTAHIYIDWATTPALLQMIDMVKQPKADAKLIAWRRFPDRHKYIDFNAFNITQATLPVTEGQHYGSDFALLKAITQFYHTNQSADFVIHGNLWWPETVLSALKIIPKHKIKNIHLYEDSVGLVAYSQQQSFSQFSPDTHQFIQMINHAQNWSQEQIFTFHMVYPTTYHISFWNKIKQEPSLKNLVQHIPAQHIKDINWHQESENLTHQQKDILFRLLDFYPEQYKKQIVGKKVHLFLLRGAFTPTQEQIDTIKKLHPLLNHSDNVFVLKEHPHLIAKNIVKKIKKIYTDIVILPKHIPFEALIFANLEPDYVSGYPSSVFFILPPEKIKYYIATQQDAYQDILLKIGKISPNQIIQSEQQNPQ